MDERLQAGNDLTNTLLQLLIAAFPLEASFVSITKADL